MDSEYRERLNVITRELTNKLVDLGVDGNTAKKILRTAVVAVAKLTIEQAPPLSQRGVMEQLQLFVHNK